MSYEPTDAEVGKLVDLLSTARWETPLVDFYQLARSILLHYGPRSNEQRCDRTGRLRYCLGAYYGDVACPGCSRCKYSVPATESKTGASQMGCESVTGCAVAATPPVAPVELIQLFETLNQQNANPVVNTCYDPVLRPPIPTPVVTEVRLAEDQFRVLVAEMLGGDWRMNRTPLESADTLISAAKEKW